MSMTKFKIATFNAYNLVLPNVRYYGEREYDQESYNRKINWMVGQLWSMDADIVAFQEVFQPQAFKDVITRSGLYDRAFVYVPKRIKNELGPLPSLVSRLPVQRSGAIARFPVDMRFAYNGQTLKVDTFSRPVIWAQIRAGTSFDFTVFVVHLKSKRPIIPDEADPDDPLVIATGKAKSLLQRTTEALALRAILTMFIRDAHMPVIVLGDFNDTAHAVTNTIICGAPPWRYTPPETTEQLPDLSLYNVLEIQSGDPSVQQQHTHTYLGFRNSLDHIFVSDAFVRDNPAHRAYLEEVRVFNDHLPVGSSSEEIPDWQSDHGQVVATFVT
jgi:endonuclease/exonuclease/phosphatase family metal-dependent hydrolase